MRAAVLALLATVACTNPARTNTLDAGAALETKTSTKAAIEFGDRGIALGPKAQFFALARAANGRVFAAGTTWTEGDATRALLACFLPDGNLAQDFGVRGVFELPRTVERPEDAFFDLAIDARGRVVAAGKAGEAGRSKTLLARVLPTGALDTTFGDAEAKSPKRGYVIGMGEEFLDDGFANVRPEKAIPDERFTAVAIDARGRIIAGGSTGDHGETMLSHSKVCGLLPSAVCHGSFRRTLVARWTEAGELDNSFHKVGYSVGNGDRRPWLSFPHDEILDLDLLSDGSVLAGGFASAGDNEHRRMLLVKYRSDGERDEEGFGTKNGFVLGPESAHAGGKREEAAAIAVAADERAVIVAGTSSDELGRSHAIVARLLMNGAFDSSFAEAGFVVDDEPIAPGDARVRAALEARGVVIAAGARLLRYSGAGAIDRSFKTTWTATAGMSLVDVAIDGGAGRMEIGGNLGAHGFVARVADSGCLDDPRAACER